MFNIYSTFKMKIDIFFRKRKQLKNYSFLKQSFFPCRIDRLGWDLWKGYRKPNRRLHSTKTTHKNLCICMILKVSWRSFIFEFASYIFHRIISCLRAATRGSSSLFYFTHTLMLYSERTRYNSISFLGFSYARAPSSALCYFYSRRRVTVRQ